VARKAIQTIPVQRIQKVALVNRSVRNQKSNAKRGVAKTSTPLLLWKLKLMTMMMTMMMMTTGWIVVRPPG